MNVPGDAAGNSYPPDTIHLEPNVSSVITAEYSSPPTSLCFILIALPIGKNHALKKFDQFALNTSCFWESTRSNITLVV